MKVFNKGIVNLYAEPSYDCETVDEAFYGRSLEVLETTANGFYKVNTDYGYIGYAPVCDVSECDLVPNKIVVAPFADLLRAPKNFYKPELTIPKGSLVCAEVSENDPSRPEIETRYATVRTPDGRTLYIHKRNLADIFPLTSTKKEYTKEEERRIRDGIVEEAKKYMGVQYRWSGKTTDGVDCSGLAFMAYMMNGFQIYRDAHLEKSEALYQIDFSEKKKGDLIFYKGHVTVYMGDEHIIHAAATPGKVGINSFVEGDDNYSEHYAHDSVGVGSLFPPESK